MTHAFEIRPKPFVLSFGQLSRDRLAPLGIEESHIRVVDLLALFCGRIGADNVEIPILHEVEIGIAAAGFSSTCKPHVAVRQQSNALVIPASALAMHDGRNNVAIVVDRDGAERVSLREVTTGRREGNSVEVVHGLTGTERIVGNGAGLLNEGDLVTLASAPALLAKKEKAGTRQ